MLSRQASLADGAIVSIHYDRIAKAYHFYQGIVPNSASHIRSLTLNDDDCGLSDSALKQRTAKRDKFFQQLFEGK